LKNPEESTLLHVPEMLSLRSFVLKHASGSCDMRVELASITCVCVRVDEGGSQ
jgi:hypothetical protein